jgi:hypothetical protein
VRATYDAVVLLELRRSGLASAAMHGGYHRGWNGLVARSSKALGQARGLPYPAGTGLPPYKRLKVIVDDENAPAQSYAPGAA